MKRTSDPILYSIRRARAMPVPIRRSSKPTPPEPDPVADLRPPSVDPPPAAADNPVPEIPPVLEAAENAAFNQSADIDSIGDSGEIIEQDKTSTGLDWLFRRNQ